MKHFRVLKSFEHYSVGDVCEPEGIYRGNLLADGLIEEVTTTAGPALEMQPGSDAGKVAPQVGLAETGPVVAEQPPNEFEPPEPEKPKRKYVKKDAVHEPL